MVLLDTMLLVLLIVGETSREYIGRHKRLAGYSPDDYDLLLDLLKTGGRVVVTPNCLTEASNHLRNIGDPMRSEISRTFRNVVDVAIEVGVPSQQATAHAQFIRLGLADVVLLSAANKETILLTADVGLYLAALGTGLRAENFNHYRFGASPA